MKHHHASTQKDLYLLFSVSLAVAFAPSTWSDAQERGGIRSSRLNAEVNFNANVNRNVHANPPIGWNMMGNRTVNAEQHVDVEAHDGDYYPHDRDNENQWGGFASDAVTAPAVGTVIHSPPPHGQPVVVNNVPYIVADGTYYQQKDSDYIVVSPPIGITVPSLPRSAVETNINGQVYFRANEIYYRPTMQDGETIYTTVAL
ncbi:DUF6515 family protein [Pedosphaera parvula]|uniref:Uncharacterized protein n=1 Tax=Pedosphaera parvula (strain Ellin514) TaxID=320771 RepID=B9XRI6_PEDPL|nr:DUF6515 family protein [Pedosphaera parvula]EEF57557.1 hypothetical protein Cflav_PD0607 [Pedosphaera parvula Ellin514]